MIKLNVFVEGKFDAFWAEIILVRAFDSEKLHISVISSGGKRAALERLMDAESGGNESGIYEKTVNVALVDADSPSVAEARFEVSRYLLKDKGQKELISSKVFFTVPTLESWLFSDPDTAKKHCWGKGKKLMQSIDRIVFVDEIPYPKEFAIDAFGGLARLRDVSVEIAHNMDLDVAINHSPSLRDFLSGVGRMIGNEKFSRIPDAGNMLGKRLITSLINETNNRSKIIYRTLSGNFVSAEDISKSILEGGELGRQYASDLLRVARDMLEREANDPDDGQVGDY